MKKITLLLAFLVIALTGCSDDDSNPTTNNDSYSAHMKTECPQSTENQVIWDECVSEAVYDYLAEERANAGVNNCCWVEFEDLDGNLVEGWLIRVEKNMVDCTSEE